MRSCVIVWLLQPSSCLTDNPTFDGEQGESESGSSGADAGPSSSGSDSGSDADSDGDGSGGGDGSDVTTGAVDDGGDGTGDPTSATASGTGDTTGVASASSTTGGPSEIVLTPEHDTFLREQFPDEVHGSDEYMRLGSGSQSGRSNRAVLAFDVSALAPDCKINGAQLRMWFYEDGQADWDWVDPTLRVHRLVADWVEGEATWIDRSSGQRWSRSGGDYDSAVVDEATVVGAQFGWVEWEIGGLVGEWCTGTVANHGVLLKEDSDGGGGQGRKMFRSREFTATPDRTPQLVVQLSG